MIYLLLFIINIKTPHSIPKRFGLDRFCYETLSAQSSIHDFICS